MGNFFAGIDIGVNKRALAYNILITLRGVGVTGWRPSPGLNPSRGCSPEPPRTSRSSRSLGRGGGQRLLAGGYGFFACEDMATKTFMVAWLGSFVSMRVAT